jgi:hypothetical protein
MTSSVRDTKNGRFSKRPGSSSRVGRVRAAQLLHSRPRLVCGRLPAQQQAMIAGHIHTHARPAAQEARSRRREAKVIGIGNTELVESTTMWTGSGYKKCPSVGPPGTFAF